MPTIELPALHRGQMAVHECAARHRVVRCGRRWGKTTFGEVEACVDAINGGPVGWFAPTYKYLLEPWENIGRSLAPIVAKKNSQDHRITLTTGGLIDFWTMDSPDPGRGRKYAKVIVDECGLVRGLMQMWLSAIRPTLTDLRGRGLFLGTPKGRKDFHTLYMQGEQGDADWGSFRGVTADNPAIDPSEVSEARAAYERIGRLDLFRQEFEGIPADDGGNPFGIAAIAACVRPMSTCRPVAFGVDLAKSHDWTWVIGLDAAGNTCVSERWQSDWRQTRRRVASIIGSVPTLVDSTGVGDPIVEDLQADGCDVTGFKFTSQSKQQLMEGLAAAIQQATVGVLDGDMRGELESFEYEFRPGGGVRYSAPEGLHDDGVCALALAVRRRAEATREDFYFRVG